MPKALAPGAPQAGLVPLRLPMLADVLEVEQRAYAHPWSRTNFADVLNRGYHAQVLMGGDTIVGYYVGMQGVQEAHLLNITVDPRYQRQGWARLMMQAFALWAGSWQAQTLWLEVRVGNARAIALYRGEGFEVVGQRKAYYAAGWGQREDALVMRRGLG